MQLASDAAARALAAFPCEVKVYTGPDRLRAYSGDGFCISIPPLPAGGPHLLTGAAAVLVALQAAQGLLCASDAALDLWCCKWGTSAWVFRAAFGDRTFALNVARDCGGASREVEAAAVAMAEDYARDPSGIVRPLGLHHAQLNGARCPVLVTEWASLDEIHAYGAQLFLWGGQRESRAHPLSAEASRLVWQAIALNRRRYSWPTPTGWCIDYLALEAGDLVGDGAAVVKKVWSRKRIDDTAAQAPS